MRQASLQNNLLDRKSTLWNVRGMLEQPNISGQDCRSEKTKDLPEGEIPRHHGKDGPQRIKTQPGVKAADLNRLVPQKSFPVLGIVTAASGAFLHLGFRCSQRLAHLKRDQTAKPVHIPVENLRDAGEQRGPLNHGAPPPASECIFSTVEFAVDF